MAGGFAREGDALMPVRLLPEVWRDWPAHLPPPGAGFPRGPSGKDAEESSFQPPRPASLAPPEDLGPLVTVTALEAICPNCGGPRPYSRRWCSARCRRAGWAASHPLDRAEYFRGYYARRKAQKIRIAT